jgi:hypothetical protein
MNPLALSPEAQPLDYGLAQPQRRRRVVRALALVAFTLLGLAAWRWGPPAWRQAQIRYYQHQCLIYSAPADQVVYEEEPAAAATLLANRSNYEPFRWDYWDPANKMPAPAAARILPFYQSFETLNGRTMRLQGGTAYEAVLFLHERTTSSGQRRLVKVTLIAEPFSFWAFVMEGDRYESQSWAQANRSNSLVEPFDTRPRHVGSPGPLHPPHLRIYAGQPDPKDASHFTIRYQTWGQEDVMDGYLVNNDTVMLKPRNPRNLPKEP